MLAFLDGQHRADVRVDPAKEKSECAGLVGEWEEEVDAAHLGITQMVAGLPVLPVVPFDALAGEVGQGTLPYAREEVLLGVVAGQAERAGFVIVNAIRAGGIGEEWRGLPESSLPDFFAFEEMAHLFAPDAMYYLRHRTVQHIRVRQDPHRTGPRFPLFLRRKDNACHITNTWSKTP